MTRRAPAGAPPRVCSAGGAAPARARRGAAWSSPPATPTRGPPPAKARRPVLRADDSARFWFSPGGWVVLAGALRSPSGRGPFPAVILMHGCGGVGNAETGWVSPLRAAGNAAVVVDSFGGRG